MRGRIAYRIASHPVFLAALVVLILNDHVLKTAYPGWVTGKASDFAGLIVFPLMMLSAIDLLTPIPVRRARLLTVGVLAATGIVFSAIQLHTGSADVYRVALGYLQFPVRAAMGATQAVAVRHTADASDLLGLVALAWSWMIFAGVAGSSGDAPSESTYTSIDGPVALDDAHRRHSARIASSR